MSTTNITIHKHATSETIPDFIKKCENFVNAHKSLSGYRFDERPNDLGRGDLDERRCEAYEDACRAYDIDYVVYSYVTPIAWHTRSAGWVEVSQKFSRTTTRHAGIVRRAVPISEMI